MGEDAILSRVLEALWSLARTGWMLRGIPAGLAETVAEHTFSSTLIALELSLRARDQGFEVDPLKATVYALVHDLGEAVIGDISRGAVDPGVKSESEKEALEALSQSLHAARVALEIGEYGSIEAAIARIAELTATAYKGVVYARIGFRRALEVSESSLREALNIAKARGLEDPLNEILELLGIKDKVG